MKRKEWHFTSEVVEKAVNLPLFFRLTDYIKYDIVNHYEKTS